MGTIEKKTCEDYLSTKWSGGQTTELLVEPDSSSLAKRDFDFRLSTATVIMNFLTLLVINESLCLWIIQLD